LTDNDFYDYTSIKSEILKQLFKAIYFFKSKKL